VDVKYSLNSTTLRALGDFTMLTKLNPTFAPDGLSGGHAPVAGRFDGSRETETRQNNHHDYDDGLVHSHSWASSTHSQPVRPFHKTNLAAV